MTSDTIGPGRGDLFACRRCGDCCKGYGGTYITENEIDNIGRYLGLGTQHVYQTLLPDVRRQTRDCPGIRRLLYILG